MLSLSNFAKTSLLTCVINFPATIFNCLGAIYDDVCRLHGDITVGVSFFLNSGEFACIF